MKMWHFEREYIEFGMKNPQAGWGCGQVGVSGGACASDG